jgi:hypothetical protein
MKIIKAKLSRIALLASIILSIAAVGISQRLSGQDTSAKGGKPRIVVLATGAGDASWTTNITAASLEDALSQSGRFELITKAQRDALVSEQGFNNSDLVDPKQAARVGKLLSAKYIVIGNALDVSAAKRKVPRGGLGSALGRVGISGGDEIATDVKAKVQIQLIDAETGVVKLSRSYEEKTRKDALSKSSSDNDKLQAGYRDVMEQIASRFAQEFGTSVPTEGLVVLVRGGRVALDIGGDQSVQVGQEFEVYTQDEPIKNAAGEVLSYVTTKYALLRIASVEPKLSWATIVETYDANGAADPQPKLDRIKVNYAVKQVK